MEKTVFGMKRGSLARQVIDEAIRSKLNPSFVDEWLAWFDREHGKNTAATAAPIQPGEHLHPLAIDNPECVIGRDDCANRDSTGCETCMKLTAETARTQAGATKCNPAQCRDGARGGCGNCSLVGDAVTPASAVLVSHAVTPASAELDRLIHRAMLRAVTMTESALTQKAGGRADIEKTCIPDVLTQIKKSIANPAFVRGVIDGE